MTQQSYSGPDPRAIKILFDMHWTSKGWRKKRLKLSKADTKIAKDAGVIFDPAVVTHDDLCKSTIAAIRSIDKRAVADAFVVSLCTRQLELRSALGSYAVFHHMEDHQEPPDDPPCSICGEYSGNGDKVDFNVLNFERFKWGGVRHQQPVYASLDLKQFQLIPRLYPTPSQVDTFKALLMVIEAAPSKTTANALEKYLGRVVDSNKSERSLIIEILGYCGVLVHSKYLSYRNEFVTCEYTSVHFKWMSDLNFPACFWRRTDGINQEALHYWFGHLL